MVKSAKPFQPEDMMRSFADMAKHSHAPDGDWQGDGWGVSWRESNNWRSYSSLLPVWKDSQKFTDVPETTFLLVHARSASFIKDKDILEYNQPYCDQNIAFVFNGLLKGVQLPQPVPGQIGAQKIWNMIRAQFADTDVKAAMRQTISLLQTNTRKIQALNLGISDGNQLLAYSQASTAQEYYTLQLHQSSDLSLVCSEKLDHLNFQPLAQGVLHRF